MVPECSKPSTLFWYPYWNASLAKKASLKVEGSTRLLSTALSFTALSLALHSCIKLGFKSTEKTWKSIEQRNQLHQTVGHYWYCLQQAMRRLKCRSCSFSVYIGHRTQYVMVKLGVFLFFELHSWCSWFHADAAWFCAVSFEAQVWFYLAMPILQLALCKHELTMETNIMSVIIHPYNDVN